GTNCAAPSGRRRAGDQRGHGLRIARPVLGKPASPTRLTRRRARHRRERQEGVRAVAGAFSKTRRRANCCARSSLPAPARSRPMRKNETAVAGDAVAAALPPIALIDAYDDAGWFANHPRRIFRALASKGATWLIFRRRQGGGPDALLRTLSPTSDLPRDS